LGNRTFDGSLDDVRLYNGILTPAEVAALASGGPPAAPSGLTATAIAYNQINLAWTDVANETGYQIERKTGSSGTYAQIGTTGTGIVTYNDTTAGTGTNYYYRILAYNGGGNSGYSNEANATTAEVSGRKGHWRLDEGTGTTAADISGNANTGNFLGSPAPIWTVTGKIGPACLSFNGGGGASDPAVNCGSGASLDNLVAQGGGGMTVSAWIKASGMGEAGLGCIVDKSVSTGGGRWRIRTEGTNQIGFIAVHATTNLQHTSVTNAIATGAWYHVLATWDGSTNAANAKIYINGIETTYAITTNGAGTRTDDASTDLSIGNEAFGNRTFNGLIDEVRVYNRVLTANEITAVYRAGL
jgi:hypothetical protein